MSDIDIQSLRRRANGGDCDAARRLHDALSREIECGRPIQVGDPVTIVVGSDRYAAVITWVSATLSSVVVSHVNDIDGTNVNVGGFGFRAIGNVTQIAREEGMFTRRRDGTYREKSKGRSVKYLIIGISESYRDLVSGGIVGERKRRLGIKPSESEQDRCHDALSLSKINADG